MALTHILVVSDVPKSNRWYQDVNRIANTRPQPFSPSTACGSFWSREAIRHQTSPTSRFEPPDKMKVSHSFTVRVEDCQASYETLKARGAEFLTPPYNWGGEIRCFFADPDGHLWEISQLTYVRLSQGITDHA